MEKKLLQSIIESKKQGKKSLALLLDPDKLAIDQLQTTVDQIHKKKVDFLFVGGSTVNLGVTDVFVKELKKLTDIPTLLFPGDFTQLTNKIDAVLFLSLFSGRNPEYLIDQHIKSAEFIKKNNTEIIPTAYLLLDGGTVTATQKVSNTTPISQENTSLILNTAIASEYMGKQLIYLEAGSGAINPVKASTIKMVSEQLSIPIIVGGGIRSNQQMLEAYNNGADIVVVGTAFEENNELLNELL